MFSPRRQWQDCNIENRTTTLEMPLMGYSMRTVDFRYTAWLLVQRRNFVPDWSSPVMDEELYDHRGESLSEFGHKELENVAKNQEYQMVLTNLRDQLISFLKKEIVYVRADEWRDMSWCAYDCHSSICIATNRTVLWSAPTPVSLLVRTCDQLRAIKDKLTNETAGALRKSQNNRVISTWWHPFQRF